MPTRQDLHDLVHRAQQRGATAAEARWVGTRGLDVVRDGGGAKATSVATDQLVVTVWTGGGQGVAEGPWARADALVDAALAAQRPCDPLSGPVPRLPRTSVGVSIADRRWPSLTESDRVEVLDEAWGALAAIPSARPEPIRWSDRAVHRVFASSAGVAVEEEGHVFRATLAVSWRDAAGPMQLGDGVASRSFASMASIPFGADLAARVAALRAPRAPVPPGPIRLLLVPRVTARLFDAIARLCVPWEAGRSFLAQHLLDARLHLQDDPALPGGLRSSAFDDRGTPPVSLMLLREGRLAERYLDALGAARADLRPTGHAVGDAIAPSNLVLRKGLRSVHVILGELGGLTFAPDDLDVDAGLDPATGRVTVRAHGTVYQGAHAVGSALQVPLTLDLPVALGEILEFSCEFDRVGHVDAPALVLGGATIGG